SDNAVRTRTVNWYDIEKRLIATAELGTEADTFSPPTTPEWTRPTTPPTADIDEYEFNGVDRNGVPAEAPLWIYVYDKRGNQTNVVDPEERQTQFWYSPAGRLVKKIENAWDLNQNMVRTTEYEHQYGRITKIATKSTNVSSVADADQVTEV